MSQTLPLAFLLKKFASFLVLPPLLPLLCIAVGLLLLRRRPRLGRTLAWSGLLLGVFLSTPATVGWLAAPLENFPVAEAQDLERGQAIVILGAGYRRHMPEYGGPTANRLALERLRYGARLAKATRLPVLVSGEAVLMTEVLKELDVIPRWQEGASLDTEANAFLTADMLLPEGIRRIVLVTHAAHMRRSVGEFTAQGFEVIPAPLGFFSHHDSEVAGFELFDYLPGPTGAYVGWYAAHEWMGLLVLKLRIWGSRLIRP